MIARRLLLPLPALLLTRCAGSAESRPGVASAPMLEMNQAGLTQGGFVAGRTAPGTRLVLEGKPVPVSADGHFALGFPRDAGPEVALGVTPPGGRTEIRRLAIAPRHWDIQRLNGLPPRQVTPNAQDLARIRAEQVRINAARAQARQCGGQSFAASAPLAWNATLAGTAESHSRAMANGNYFDHRDRDGRTPGDRAELAGYTGRQVGENIAAALPTARKVLDGWLASPGHCANLMNPAYTELGAAYAVDPQSDAAIYWTAMFGAP